jgi:ABC-type Zn uptake system ZnuABC Zn-binding protein ZnuA
LLALLPACSKGCGSGKSSERARIVVSIFPVYDLVRRVAGPDADVTLLVPPGQSEHGFVPAAKDVEAARQTKLGIMVGLGLDPWMEGLMKEASPSARVLKVGDRVPTLSASQDPVGAEDHEHDDADAREGKGAPDPHVWLDPQRAQLIVRAIAEELGRVDGSHALAYRERATALDSSLVALDKEAEERLSAVKRRGFVPFHPAFSYFAERYRLSIVAVVEKTPGTPPTPDHAAKVVAAVKEKNVPALYSEPQLDAAPAKSISEQAKIALGSLDPLGGGPDADTYEKMIRFDLGQLEQHQR